MKTVPVLVTGAGRGIGKRLAIGFATRGARVGLLARSKAELDLCQLEIEHAGGSALRIRTDVCDYEQVSAAVERMRVHFANPVQVLVCAAAVQGPIGPFAETAPKSGNRRFMEMINKAKLIYPATSVNVLIGDHSVSEKIWSVKKIIIIFADPPSKSVSRTDYKLSKIR